MEPINNTPIILDTIFRCCPPMENATQNAFVCKAWRESATRIAKLQLVENRIDQIQERAEPFLRLVPLKLEILCASYRNLLAFSKNVSSLTVKEVQATLNNTFTEKYTVCLSRFFRVNPEDPNIPELRQTCLAGKVFVEIHHEVDVLQYNGRPKTIAQWVEKEGSRSPLERVHYFPIELFNLNVTGQDDRFAIQGEINIGTFCIPLRGRLIEFTLEESTPEVQLANFTGFPHTQRTNAMTLPLTPQSSNRGRIWPHTIYSASLDSQPLSK